MIEHPPARRRRPSFPLAAGLLILAFIGLCAVVWFAWSRSVETAPGADPRAVVQPAEVPAPLPPARRSPGS